MTGYDATNFFPYYSNKKVNLKCVTERKQINMGKLLNLGEEYVRAVFFLQLFSRLEVFSK